MKRNLVVGFVLMCSFSLSVFMTPKKLIASNSPKIDLETMIPKKIGNWRIDETQAGFVVSPDVQEKLDLIYNQTLSRTYVNSNGDRMMLAIAYGGDQSDSMQVHKPEVCYPAQGLTITRQWDDVLSLPHRTVPVRRLVAQQGRRHEPITYWIRMGDTVALSSLKQKLAKMSYTLSGSIPDGLLFRVSTIGQNDQEIYRMQDDFVNQLANELDSTAEHFVFGKSS